MTPPIRIAVAGAGNAPPDECLAAEEVGRRIAEAGAVLVCGGGMGVMEAAARGAVAAGGITVGLLPGHDAGEANDHIRIPLPTAMGEGRNVLVARSADALIAIGGEWGTLSEVALARKMGVPVVLLRPTLTRHLGLPEAASPAGAVEMALDAAREARRTAGLPDASGAVRLNATPGADAPEIPHRSA
ncbi:MAG TPA: TIGR00725 family protein [Longimicrobiales bacterium]|nr:TIGR00725 family protein [Longimicrobiales bacterium]